jgi:hypothetical protein
MLGALAIVSTGAVARAEKLPRSIWRNVRCSDDGVLPAITDLDAFYGSAGTEGAAPPCPKPRIAMVAGLFGDPAELTRVWRALHTDNLSFGYPFVAPAVSMWLDVPASKMAIVAGLFASAAGADDWSKKHPGFRQVRIRPRVNRSDSWVAVEMFAPDSVPAFDRTQAMRFAQQAMKMPKVSRETGEAIEPELPRRKLRLPICRVPGDGLFIFREADFERLQSTPWRDGVLEGLDFLPIRCGERFAYVDPRTTAFRAALWTDRAGARRVTQITEYHCGYTTFTIFAVGEQGRRTQQREIGVSHDGC